MNQKPVFLTITLTALLVIGGAFWLMQKRQVAMNQLVAVDPVVETLVQTEPEKYPQHIDAIPGNTDEVWYNIPEYGVRMKLNREFAEDLVYRFVHEKNTKGEEWDIVYLSLKKLEEVVPGCGGHGALGKFEGNLVEMSVKNNESDLYVTTRISQYTQAGNYYYGWVGGHDVCWDPSLEKKVREVFPGRYIGDGAKNMFDGVRTIELIPQK